MRSRMRLAMPSFFAWAMRFNSYMGQRSWGRRAQSPLVPLEKPIPGVFRSCDLLVVELLSSSAAVFFAQ